jgi:hypothetical protein
MRRIASLLLIFALAGFAAAGFDPSREPVSPSGVKAVCDLPAGQHIKNVGGSDGAGLCVFTSVEHSARWQNVRDLDGFQRWMTRRPGGGWPQKLDQMLAAYAREKGVSLPPYIQHTGGDESFLLAALKTDRMPCITYAGRDDFYRGRIAHMVNLAHLDGERAAIIDNNRPGVWLWMTRAELLQRWRDMDGGWAVVLLAAPPPPHPEAKAQAFDALPCDGSCICGDKCKCEAGKCPGKCPVVMGDCPGDVRQPSPATGNPPRPFGQCVGPSWGVPVSPGRAAPQEAPVYETEHYRWQDTGNGVWQWVPKVQPAPVQAVGDIENYGVDPSRIHSAPRYSINGVEVPQRQALLAMAGGSPLSDDSDRWHLTAVGDESFGSRVAADLDRLAPDVRGKLLFQAYRPTDWAVAAFKLPGGVSLRRPSPVRSASDVGVVAASEWKDGALTALLQRPGGPVAPPKVDPVPIDPNQPIPNPMPGPKPVPDGNGLLVLLVVGVLAYLFFRK